MGLRDMMMVCKGDKVVSEKEKRESESETWM
jgi:hypothetical protein